MSKVATNGIEHDADDHGAKEAAEHGYARSPHFEVLERKARAADGRCIMTGIQDGTQWHHWYTPFHFARYFGRWELEFSPRNLVWLVQVPGNEKHRIVGHLGFFQSYNPSFMASMQWWRGLSDEQIESDGEYQAAVKARPRSLRDIPIPELVDMKAALDEALPVLNSELLEYAKYAPAGLQAHLAKGP